MRKATVTCGGWFGSVGHLRPLRNCSHRSARSAAMPARASHLVHRMDIASFGLGAGRTAPSRARAGDRPRDPMQRRATLAPARRRDSKTLLQSGCRALGSCGTASDAVATRVWRGGGSCREETPVQKAGSSPPIRTRESGIRPAGNGSLRPHPSLCAGPRHGRGPREWNGMDPSYGLARRGRPAGVEYSLLEVFSCGRGGRCALHAIGGRVHGDIRAHENHRR